MIRQTQKGQILKFDSNSNFQEFLEYTKQIGVAQFLKVLATAAG
jgi:hypothetical protein